MQFRLGLCCLFHQEPIRFRTTTAKVLRSKTADERLRAVSALCLHNAESLREALSACHRLGIGAFRITSPLFPLYTHPEVGYRVEALPDAEAIRATLAACRDDGNATGMRRSLHPDPFVLLNSPRPEVVQASIAELEYQALLAEWTGAEVINLHIGGVYGDKRSAMRRFAEVYRTLSEPVRARLSIENDDGRYTPSDALFLSEELGLPVVYDVHHHRCRPDGLSVGEATARCAATWTALGREPYFHLSSPRDGWQGRNPRAHADRIDPNDFPTAWFRQPGRGTVDVEAKAKECAVAALRQWLAAHPDGIGALGGATSGGAAG